MNHDDAGDKVLSAVYVALPEILQFIADIIGVREAVSFAEENHGEVFSVSARPNSRNRLFVVLGRQGYARLLDDYGPGRFTCPRARTGSALLAVHEAMQEGASSRAIAQRVGCAPRTVQRYKALLRRL